VADAQTADLVILGAGSGGYACALRAAELGLSVLMVEKDKVGGTCLHRGCIPTKALLHAAEVADAAREGEKVGVRSSLDGIDVEKVNAYKDGVVSRLHKGLTGLVKQRGITVIEGSGRLVAPNAVEVDGTRYEATKAVVLATGSYSRSLPGLEIDGERIITSENVMPRRRNARSSCFELASSSSGSRWGSASTMVTSAPNDFQTLANSTPMTPPPSTTTDAGTLSSVNACSLVMIRSPSTSSPGSDRE